MAPEAGRLTRGAFVRVRHEGDADWVPAMVALASWNGRSVVLLFDGAIRAGEGSIARILPLWIDYEAETVTGLTGDVYEIEVAG